MRRTLLIATLLAAAVPALNADVAPDPRGIARGVEPYGENVPVTMKWEEVDLVPAPDRLDVTAVFGLLNTGATDLSIDVGFPELRGQPLHDFKVDVEANGKPVAVQSIEPVKTNRSRKPANLPEWVAFRGYDRWHSWKMDFPRGVERKVTVRYWVAPTPNPFGNERALPEEMRPKLASLTTGYILHTGSLWSGPIGRAVVRIHYGDAFPKTLVRRLSPPWRNWRDKGPIQSPWKHDEKARTDTLVLNDVKPTWQHDIEIDYKKITLAEEIDLLVKAMKDGQALPPFEIERVALLLEEDKAGPAAADRRAKQVYVYERLTADVEREMETARKHIEAIQRAMPVPMVSFGEEHSLYATDCLRQRALRALITHYRESRDAAKARETAVRYDRVLVASEEYWASKASSLEKVAAAPSPKENPNLRENAGKAAAECREKAAAFQKERQALAPQLKGNGKTAAGN